MQQDLDIVKVRNTILENLKSGNTIGAKL